MTGDAPPPATEDPSAPAPALHPDILRLGLVSFFTDLSSEMIFSVFAVVFTTVAGASAALLGLIEGCADAAASSLNAVAGWWSDRSGKRRRFVFAGYAFSTLAKALLLLGQGAAGLATFRVVERLGKGFRGPPRDAWLASIASAQRRGYSFGVHKALDKAGAVLGPLLAYALLRWLGETPAGYQVLFAVALVPALLSLVVLAGIADRPAPPRHHEPPLRSWQALSPSCKRFLAAAGLFSLAYFSLGFLLVKAHAAGFGVAEVVLLYALFNASCVIAAPLAGQLADRHGRLRVVATGYALFALIQLGFVFADAPWQFVALFVAYGVFLAIDESQSKAFVADLEPERRATALGAYGFVTGLAYLPASLIAGALWLWAPAAAFMLAALLATAALLLLLRWRPQATIS